MSVLVQDVVDKVVYVAPRETGCTSVSHSTEGGILVDDVADADCDEGRLGTTVGVNFVVIQEEISDEIGVWFAGTVCVQPVVVCRMFLVAISVRAFANPITMSNRGGAGSGSQNVESVDQLGESDNTVLVSIMVTEVSPEALVDFCLLQRDGELIINIARKDVHWDVSLIRVDLPGLLRSVAEEGEDGDSLRLVNGATVITVVERGHEVGDESSISGPSKVTVLVHCCSCVAGKVAAGLQLSIRDKAITIHIQASEGGFEANLAGLGLADGTHGRVMNVTLCGLVRA